jgi:hypothetical protein
MLALKQRATLSPSERGERTFCWAGDRFRRLLQPRELVRAGSLSRMGEFSDAMPVRQLIDLVAFLQSTYEVRPRPQPYGL